MTPDEFLKWELHSRDTIDLKRIYIDIAEDLASGVLLSQLIYWHLPDKKGQTKITVEKEGKLWIRKKREDWWEECRLKPRQFDKAAVNLETLGICEQKNFVYEGRNTKHIRLNMEMVIDKIKKCGEGQLRKSKCHSPNGKCHSPNGKCESDREPELTNDLGDENLQTTLKNTTENTRVCNVQPGKTEPNISEQSIECNPDSNQDCNIECIFDNKYVVESFVNLYSVLKNRNPNVNKLNKTVGDVNKFRDRDYRYNKKFSGKYITEALNLYDALPDDHIIKLEIKEYISHERQKWDFSKTKNKDAVFARFVLEYLYVTPNFQHYKYVKESGLLADDLKNYEGRHKAKKKAKSKKQEEPDPLHNIDLDKLAKDYRIKMVDIAEEFDFSELAANTPNDNFDRKKARAANKCNLSNEEFKKFKEAKQKNFNGEWELVKAYVAHELCMYDFSKVDDKEGVKQQLATKFQKEAFVGHPIFERYKGLTDVARAMELP